MSPWGSRSCSSSAYFSASDSAGPPGGKLSSSMKMRVSAFSVSSPMALLPGPARPYPVRPRPPRLRRAGAERERRAPPCRAPLRGPGPGRRPRAEAAPAAGRAAPGGCWGPGLRLGRRPRTALTGVSAGPSRVWGPAALLPAPGGRQQEGRCEAAALRGSPAQPVLPKPPGGCCNKIVRPSVQAVTVSSLGFGCSPCNLFPLFYLRTWFKPESARYKSKWL